jgi:hypothetical protein
MLPKVKNAQSLMVASVQHATQGFDWQVSNANAIPAYATTVKQYRGETAPHTTHTNACRAQKGSI